jgi:hypothetical protein
MKHRSLALALVIALGGTLAACNQSSAPETTASPTPAATPAESPSPAATDAGATGAADAGTAAAVPAVAEEAALAAQSNGAPLGVAACDDYLQKYEACVSARVPEAARDSLLKSLAASREAWRQAIASPGGADALAAACTQAREAAKASMQAYGCTDF